MFVYLPFVFIIWLCLYYFFPTFSFSRSANKYGLCKRLADEIYCRQYFQFSLLVPSFSLSLFLFRLFCSFQGGGNLLFLKQANSVPKRIKDLKIFFKKKSESGNNNFKSKHATQLYLFIRMWYLTSTVIYWNRNLLNSTTNDYYQ